MRKRMILGVLLALAGMLSVAAQDAVNALIRTGVCNPDGTPKEQIVTDPHY